MKLLVDVQLPIRLAELLAALDHDVIHTTDLARGNRSTDDEIARVADDEGRIVVTKDHDFLDGHLLKGSPRRLLLVSTGNISNDDLVALFLTVEHLITDSFERATLVEVNRAAVIVH